MKRFYFISLIFFLCVIRIFGQAGNYVYKTLDLPVSSYISAMGGMNISSPVNDISLSTQNPALLKDEQHQYIGVNFSGYIGESNFFSAMYGHKLTEKDMISGTIQYVNYGNINHRTEENIDAGELYVGELVLYASYCRLLAPKWRVGASLKPVGSFLADYNSFGLAVDVGANFYDSKIGLSTSLLFKDIGVQIKNYNSWRSAWLPFSIQAGLTYKLKNAPFAFSFTAHNLQRWNLNPNPAKKVNFADMLFRHTVWSVEFTPWKSVYLAISYNHRRGAELSIPDKRSLAGFSAGLGFRVYKFNLGASITPYQAGILSYQVSVSSSLSEFTKNIERQGKSRGNGKASFNLQQALDDAISPEKIEE